MDAEWRSDGIKGDTAGSHPYSERRLILEDLNGPRWRTPQAFDDGEAPWNAVCAHELEGVVGKSRRRCVPGAGGWIKRQTATTGATRRSAQPR
jgi:hypothetical protein